MGDCLVMNVLVMLINIQSTVIYTVNVYYCRIASTLEGIVGNYSEGLNLTSDQQNITQTFISDSREITISGFKVSE